MNSFIFILIVAFAQYSFCCDSFDRIYPYALCCEKQDFSDSQSSQTCYFSYDNLNDTTIRLTNETVNWIIDGANGELSKQENITFHPGFRGMTVAYQTTNPKSLRWELTNYQTNSINKDSCVDTNITLNIEFNGTIPEDPTDLRSCIDASIMNSTNFNGTIILNDFVNGTNNFSINFTVFHSEYGSNYNASYSIIENFEKHFNQCSTKQFIDLYGYKFGTEVGYKILNCDALKTKPIVVLALSIILALFAFGFLIYIAIRIHRGVTVTVFRTDTRDDDSVYEENEENEEEIENMTIWKRPVKPE